MRSGEERSVGAEEDFGKGRYYIKEGLRRAGVGAPISGGERYVGNDRSESLSMIREGLSKSGARSDEGRMGTSDEIGAILMQRSEERLAQQRRPVDDAKPIDQMTAKEMILRGLTKANGGYEPTSNKMSDPPRTPRR